MADIRTDEFEEGEVLAELSTGDVIHAPCAGYLEWCIPAGKMVRVDGELGVVVP